MIMFGQDNIREYSRMFMNVRFGTVFLFHLAPYIQEGILPESVGETLNSTEDEEGGES